MKLTAIFLIMVMFFGCQSEGEKYWGEELRDNLKTIELALHVLKRYPSQQFQRCLVVFNDLGEHGEHLLVGGQVDTYPVSFHLYVIQGHTDNLDRIIISMQRGLGGRDFLSFSKLGIIQESSHRNIPSYYKMGCLVDNGCGGWAPDLKNHGMPKYFHLGGEIAQMVENELRWLYREFIKTSAQRLPSIQDQAPLVVRQRGGYDCSLLSNFFSREI